MTGGLIALVVTLVVATAAGLAMRRYSGRFGRKEDKTDVLTEADLGAGLGERATLVQFSTAFCAPCRPTRVLLAQVAGMVDGVRHVDIDATTRLDLVRRFKVSSTPTVLVLGPGGEIAKRAAGLPRKADVIAALGQVIGLELSTSSTGLVDNTGNSTRVTSGRDSRSESE